MPDADIARSLAELSEGRTDLISDLLAAGLSANFVDQHGVSLIQHCAYYGDVTAIKLLLAQGASLATLGLDLGITGAAFHGHWRLCHFLLEQGANPNHTDSENGETPLHAALCTNDRAAHDQVLAVLLAAGADPNAATRPGADTGGFMRDVRTKGETPLHRAAAFGTEDTITMLLDAGASKELRDANGDSPLSWASWYLRPNPILRLLLFGNYRIHPQNKSMRANLIGKPLPTPQT
ncbi:ankyrin repeat domain-containing protein [Granulicella sibirica]|uniref:Ankyrin n=1 Tax=Granulicella sibirica TaxID=2479048 RepID=A0A4Q0T0L6_9BACT|nr:ankyrin repeat domain-containing protein [Granulicella sibirica]RXH55359.1 Ankyrin [Granulicella sibirica]